MEPETRHAGEQTERMLVNRTHAVKETDEPSGKVSRRNEIDEPT